MMQSFLKELVETCARVKLTLPTAPNLRLELSKLVDSCKKVRRGLLFMGRWGLNGYTDHLGQRRSRSRHQASSESRIDSPKPPILTLVPRRLKAISPVGSLSTLMRANTSVSKVRPASFYYF